MGRTRTFDQDEVLDRALSTFWERGHDATSMADLCESMGLGPGSVYAAFGDKHALYMQCLRRYAETVSTEAIERIHASASGMQGIRNYFEALVDAMVHGKRRWGCFLTNSVVEFASRDPAMADLFKAHFLRLETAFAGALARAQAANELRPGAGPKDAALLVAVVQGMNVLAKATPGKASLTQVADAAVAGLVSTSG